MCGSRLTRQLESSGRFKPRFRSAELSIGELKRRRNGRGMLLLVLTSVWGKIET